MSWELSRRRFVRTVSTTYLFGRLPLVHLLVMAFHLAFLAKLAARYNSYYEQRPVVTMMVTNAILHGIADTLAQTITAVQARSRIAGLPSYSKNTDDPIPLHRLSKQDGVIISEKEMFDPSGAKVHPSFDFERLTRFAAWGFCVAPMQYRWFGFLSRVFPMVPGKPAFGQALKRVAFDQLVYSPFSLTLFFTAMTVAEGGGRRAVTNKLRDMFVPTLKANYVLWPAVQIINFRLMPVQFQLPVSSTVGIAWTAYLSLTNASNDEHEARTAPQNPASRIRQA